MHSKNICITTVISLASMLTISNAAFAESKVARVYNEGQNIVAEIPYFEVETQNTKKAYQVLLKSPSDPLSFTVDLSSLQEIPLNNNSDSLDCIPASGKTTSIATAKLYIEHNATDEDTGVHGLFDDHGWSELCVYDPNGKQVLAVKPQSQLKDLTMAGIFFESREPPNSEFSIADLKKNFPEGKYNIRGISYDGTGLIGAPTFSHDIPAKPNITYPELVEDEEDTKDAKKIPITNLVIRWDHVTKTITDEVVTITGYEVIVTKEIDDDPHGLSKPILDVHVLPTKNSLTIPIEFIEPDTLYELEILALEKSGNQTISAGFFKTVADYNPVIDPNNFVTTVNNPYFPLVPGTTYTYKANTEDGVETIKLSVTDQTKIILGITCVVVRDTVTLNDQVIEDTHDWYAQDKDGNVWYMGEYAENYENGVLVDTDGSWEAGVDGAKPGIIMKANPQVGDVYRQEYYKGEAEDMAEVISLNESVKVTYSSYDNTLKTKDWSALEPDVVEHKYYATDVGVVLEVDPKTGERLELVDISVK